MMKFAVLTTIVSFKVLKTFLSGDIFVGEWLFLWCEDYQHINQYTPVSPSTSFWVHNCCTNKSALLMSVFSANEIILQQ